MYEICAHCESLGHIALIRLHFFNLLIWVKITWLFECHSTGNYRIILLWKWNYLYVVLAFVFSFVAELLRQISVRSKITITINQEKSMAIKYRFLSIMLKLNTVVESWGLGFGFGVLLLMDGLMAVWVTYCLYAIDNVEMNKRQHNRKHMLQ